MSEERVALIPGGARGIGRATGLALAQAGWRVALAYRESVEAAGESCRAIESAGGTALALRADVSDPRAAEALVRAVEDRWGRVDALVHAAGPFRRVPLLDETPQAWQSTVAANLHAVFYLARLVAPGMQARRWGRIVAFGLASADQPTAHPTITAYAAAKAGLLVLVRALARTLAADGVTVNLVSPGVIDSGGLPPEDLEAMRPHIPAGYVGAVEDAVAAARFFMSDEARYVTGTNLHVSGGWGI